MKDSQTIIGKAPALKSLLRNVQIIAPTGVNVLITGETGTGKELIAAAIQKNSLRSDKVFITLNCVALPESLIESELFGTVKVLSPVQIRINRGFLQQRMAAHCFWMKSIHCLYPFRPNYCALSNRASIPLLAP